MGGFGIGGLRQDSGRNASQVGGAYRGRREALRQSGCEQRSFIGGGRSGPAARRADWHPVQAAFEQAQAAQCGYCLNGMVMQAAALLARDPNPRSWHEDPHCAK